MVCVYCCEGFEDPALFRHHMNEEHPTFTLRIAFIHCSEGYVKADCTDIRCRLCASRCENLEDTAKHLFFEHNIPLNLSVEVGMQPFKLVKDRLHCAICNTKSLCMRQLSRHTQSHFLKFTCESCGKSYATMTSLKAHVRFSHISDERICRKCKATFSNLDALRKHTAESKRCWAYLCTVCGERFMTWTLKQAHLVETHGTERKNYVCPECSELFFSRHKFRVHFKIKHTDDNYACPCCGMKFDTKKNLEEHRVTHTKERLFPCTVCSKSFPRKKNLVQHMWIHSEFKRFECKICNKQFNQRVSWRTHMKAYHPDLGDAEAEKNNKVKFLYSVLKADKC